MHSRLAKTHNHTPLSTTLVWCSRMLHPPHVTPSSPRPSPHPRPHSDGILLHTQ